MSSQYASIADLLARYEEKDIVKISYRTAADRDTMNEGAVNTALIEASSEIDEYVGARYILPLTAVSPQIIQFACIIARFYLEKGIRVESATKDYERTIQRLEALKNGETTLGLDDNEEVPQLSGDGVVVQSDEPVWNRKKSGGFI